MILYVSRRKLVHMPPQSTYQLLGRDVDGFNLSTSYPIIAGASPEVRQNDLVGEINLKLRDGLKDRTGRKKKKRG